MQTVLRTSSSPALRADRDAGAGAARRWARRLVAVLLGLTAALPLAGAAPAQASELQVLCGPGIGGWTHYSCMAGSGYTGQSVWGANYGRTGHNCTSWVSYRLAQAGLRQWASPMGNASEWDNRAAGVWRVDGTPAVGSVAQWDGGSRYASQSTGHVGMVTAVTASYIDVLEDSYSGTDRLIRLARGSSFMPSHFIHTEDGAPSLRGDAGPTSTARDLFFVRTKNSGTGTVELHTATAASGYATADLHTPTLFRPADAANGEFVVVGRDLWFLKERNTGSGRVEVHIASAASGYRQATLHSTTLFTEDDARNGSFHVVGRDLYFIKERNTGSGRAEVHAASAASGYQQATLHSSSLFTVADATNGTMDLVGTDLTLVKTRNTPGTVELHIASADSRYQQASLHTRTLFSPSVVPDGRFDVVGRDLIFTRTRNTGSTKTTVQSATAASGWSRSDVDRPTLYTTAEAADGTMGMANS